MGKPVLFQWVIEPPPVQIVYERDDRTGKVTMKKVGGVIVKKAE